jgi:hypothetical protein
LRDRDVAAERVGGLPPTGPDRPRPTLPVAALLFAPASVLGYMSGNLNQTSPLDVAPALAGALGFALVVCLAAAAARRRADAPAAAIACVWVVAGLYYLGLFGGLNTWIAGDYTLVATLPFALAGLVLLTLALRCLGALCAPIHVVMSTVAAVMVATPLWQAAAYEVRNGDARAIYDPARAAEDMAPVVSQGDGEGRPPDIYHFVFDRYASEGVLAEHFGVEPAIGAFLEDRGFYVADDSRANYLKTGHSLASTFYMDYLDLLADAPTLDGANWHPIFAMLDDHRVARFLQARGYEVVQFGAWWTGTQSSAAADVNRPHGLSEFAMYYLRRTALRTLVGLAPDVRLATLIDWDNGQCQRVARQLDEIKAIGAGDRPVYVFAHFLLPHDPYAFGPDGRCLSLFESNTRGRSQGYVDQVAYADRIIEDIVPALQDDRPAPVILIQADEGPYPDRDYGVPWQDAPAEELRIKTGILNAFYFPDADYGGLAADITPVNSYRTVFNKYFATDYARLPDRVFAFPDDVTLYEFHDVTDKVRGAPEPAAAGALGAGEAGSPDETKLR